MGDASDLTIQWGQRRGNAPAAGTTLASTESWTCSMLLQTEKSPTAWGARGHFPEGLFIKDKAEGTEGKKQREQHIQRSGREKQKAAFWDGENLACLYSGGGGTNMKT